MTSSPTEPTLLSSAPSAWRWWVCGVLLLATTLNYMDRITLNLMSKEIKQEFRIANVDYGILESGFQVAFGIGAVVFGVIVDRYGVRTVYPVAVVGWSVAGFLTGYADTYWTLFGCRMMLGIFEAGNWPCGIRTVRQVMTRDERSLGNSVFQSGTGLGAIVTPPVIGLCLWWVSDPTAWRVPFRVIGLIGLGWVFVWWFTVPKRVLANPVAPANAPREPFAAVFRDRRFWVLVAVIIGVNTCWHTFRVWLPLHLREDHGYTPEQSLRFNTLYFIVADIGSWLVGFAVVGLRWRKFSLHSSRMWVFAVGVVFTMASAALPFVPREWMEPVVLLTGFGGLGLFATYFALSQEISGANQGKITGTLGCINSLYLAALYWVQGAFSDWAGGHVKVLAVAWVPAAVALVAVLIFWPKDRAEPG
jgi:MFS transporter, ACS family, hexuronate transporter